MITACFLRETKAQLAARANVGIHYDQVIRQPQEEGVHKFTDSFHMLFTCIDTKRKVSQQEQGVSSRQIGMIQDDRAARERGGSRHLLYNRVGKECVQEERYIGIALQ
jgi:hypothetical protein